MLRSGVAVLAEHDPTLGEHFDLPRGVAPTERHDFNRQRKGASEHRHTLGVIDHDHKLPGRSGHDLFF